MLASLTKMKSIFFILCLGIILPVTVMSLQCDECSSSTEDCDNVESGNVRTCHTQGYCGRVEFGGIYTVSCLANCRDFDDGQRKVQCCQEDFCTRRISTVPVDVFISADSNQNSACLALLAVSAMSVLLFGSTC